VEIVQVSYAAQWTKRKLDQNLRNKVAANLTRISQGDCSLHSIFISYRRDDSEGEAGRLADDLAHRFREESVFMDVNAIQPGRDFRKAIDESIHKCSVLLAILGPGWLESKNGAGQKRLEDENDFVRLEIASALQRDIAVVPVLVRGARMPRADQLPVDLKELAFRNAVELTHARWKSDVQVLVEALKPCLEPYQVAPNPPVVEAKPAVTSFEAPVLERVSRELALHIGPIAEIVVKRAAKRCATLADLCEMVAQEIEGAPARARFLASCARSLTPPRV
jgi:TIR domain